MGGQGPKAFYVLRPIAEKGDEHTTLCPRTKLIPAWLSTSSSRALCAHRWLWLLVFFSFGFVCCQGSEAHCWRRPRRETERQTASNKQTQIASIDAVHWKIAYWPRAVSSRAVSSPVGTIARTRHAGYFAGIESIRYAASRTRLTPDVLDSRDRVIADRVGSTGPSNEIFKRHGHGRHQIQIYDGRRISMLLSTYDQMLPAGADIPIRRRKPSGQLLLLLFALLKKAKCPNLCYHTNCRLVCHWFHPTLKWTWHRCEQLVPFVFFFFSLTFPLSIGADSSPTPTEYASL